LFSRVIGARTNATAVRDKLLENKINVMQCEEVGGTPRAGSESNHSGEHYRLIFAKANEATRALGIKTVKISDNSTLEIQVG
jgi:hypothetical protein